MANTLRFKRGLASGIPTALAGEPLFTTDTFDLYIGNGTTNTRFQKYIASGATTQILRGDGSLYTFPLAISSPSNGQVLKYNGTSWVNDSDAGITGSLTTNYLPKATGATTLGNSLVYDNGTNVGIGTASPGAKLEVYDSTLSTQYVRSSQQILKFTASNSDGKVDIQNIAGDPISFTIGSERARITGLGNFHIGTFSSDSGEKLQVTGTMKVTGASSFGAAMTVSAGNISLPYEVARVILGTQSASGDVHVGASGVGSPSVGNQDYGYYIAQNAYRQSNGAWKHSRTSTIPAVRHLGSGGVSSGTVGFYWDYSANVGTADITWTNLMHLTTSGNLGLGVTLAAWRNLFNAFQVGYTGALYSLTVANATEQVNLASNYYQNSAGNELRIQAGFATRYQQGSGEHRWSTAASSTANSGITFTQAMTLDASGNLALGTTNVGYGKFGVYNASNTLLGIANSTTYSNFQQNSSDLYINTNLGTASGGSLIFRFGSSATEAGRIHSTGNFGLGTVASDSGEKLQVNGTAKITGATTVNAAFRVDNNGYVQIVNNANAGLYLNNGSTQWQVYNNTSNNLIFNNGAGNTVLTLAYGGAATFSSSVTVGGIFQTYRIKLVESTYNTNFTIYTGVDNANSIGFYNETSGVYNFKIGSTGAATFSSSVTAASGIFTGNLTVDTNTLFVDATNNRVGIGTITPSSLLHAYGTTGVTIETSSGNIKAALDFTSAFYGGTVGGMYAYPGGGSIGNNVFGESANSSIETILFSNSSSKLKIGTVSTDVLSFYTNSLPRINITSGGDVGIGMTPSYKLDVTGSARVSDAIAIGTTPDTNNPFKILKNINATVGIKFENTNTSSSAFSAVQLGTDVSGGTKFTNLVYASSGISASGVYNPDGTSLINNGNGGLNFLGNPIRMYTGGSNGVLRWDLVNDGYITHYSATAPTTSATDGYRQYSADVTAGNAAPHFRTENGAVIKLYQETTAVGNAIFNQGGGNAVLDDSTFAGYTLRQIVKALQNQGILA
jgi:hypothetical protein